MPLSLSLGLILALLTVGLYAIIASQRARCSPQVYGASLSICIVLLGLGLTTLLSGGTPITLALPMGLPWLGAHFRLDALSAFFLIVVNLAVFLLSDAASFITGQ